MGNDSTRAGATATAAKHEEAKHKEAERALGAHLQAQGVSIGGLDLGTVLHWVTQIAKLGGQKDVARYLKIAAEFADDAQKFGADKPFNSVVKGLTIAGHRGAVTVGWVPDGG
jgi:hypothetical protein